MPAAQKPVVLTAPAHLSNLEFLEQHARPGCIGLVGGASAIDRAIRSTESALTPDGRASAWSHVFIFEGLRVDGRHWVVESDLDARRDGLRLGVQENRIDKYAKAEDWPNIAVLDFGLSDAQARTVLTAALDLTADGTRYALGGIVQVWAAMLRGRMWKEREKRSAFCSAFVQAVFETIDLRFAPGIATRYTTPEHVAQCEEPHTRHVLIREP